MESIEQQIGSNTERGSKGKPSGRAKTKEAKSPPKTELFKEPRVSADARAAVSPQVDARSVKRVVSRLHSILRDTDGDSSIVQRFDELTKLLFLKLVAERAEEPIFVLGLDETPSSYAKRLRKSYSAEASKYPTLIPAKFSELNCSDSAIAQCGALLAPLSFASANFDVKGVAYEEVIRGTFDKSDHQQFFTPHQVVSFMVSMMNPFITGVVADPACGTAGFLAEVVRTNAHYKKLLGLEIDDRLAWVAGINLLLHGATSFETRCLNQGGTLGPLVSKDFGKLDCILTNPPFGSDLSDSDALSAFTLGQGRTSRRRGVLFIERCWELLKEGGTLSIVIDEGVLNLPSAVDVRRFILERFDILAIVSLPESAFMPYANVNASMLFLRKSSGKARSERVFFGKAEEIGRKANGDDDIIYDDFGNARPNSDLPDILASWKCVLAGKTIEPSETAFIANVRDHLKNDESLRFDFRYHHPSRFKSQELLERAKHKLVSLSDLCDERNDSIVPALEMSDQVILYTGLANIEAGNGVAHQVPTPAASLKSAVKRYEPGDIIFARMRPNLRKIALIAFKQGGYASPECIVLTIKKNSSGNPLIDPTVLAAVLRSDLVFGQIMHLVAGIGRPRLNTKDLRKVRIPLPPVSFQEVVRSRFTSSIADANVLREKAKKLLEDAQKLEFRAVNEIADRMSSG